MATKQNIMVVCIYRGCGRHRLIKDSFWSEWLIMVGGFVVLVVNATLLMNDLVGNVC